MNDYDYDMTTMRIASSSVFFRRLTYALFIGWVVYGVYLLFMGDWWSVNLLMVFIAFGVSFIAYRMLDIITQEWRVLFPFFAILDRRIWSATHSSVSLSSSSSCAWE